MKKEDENEREKKKHIVEIVIDNNKWPIVKLSILGEMHEIEMGKEKRKTCLIIRVTGRCRRMCPSKWRGNKTENSQLERAVTNDEIVNFIISILTLPPPHLRLSFRMIVYDLDQIDTTVDKNMLL